jgi:hypothetical protein
MHLLLLILLLGASTADFTPFPYMGEDIVDVDNSFQIARLLLPPARLSSTRPTPASPSCSACEARLRHGETTKLLRNSAPQHVVRRSRAIAEACEPNAALPISPMDCQVHDGVTQFEITSMPCA